MNTPAFPTAIPHDDSKALSAVERQRFNAVYRRIRDNHPDTDQVLLLLAATVIHTVLVDDTHTEDAA